MKQIIFLCLFLFVSLSHITGGWIKDSLTKNSLYIDRSRSLAEKTILSKYNLDENKYSAYPLEIYSQLVNGFNYKLIFAFYNTENQDIEIYSGIVYSGPFSQQVPNFEAKETKKFTETNGILQSNEKNSISKVLKEYFNEYFKSSYSTFSSYSIYDNLVDTKDKTMIYVLNVQDEKVDKIVIFKDESNKYSVDAVIYKPSK